MKGKNRITINKTIAPDDMMAPVEQLERNSSCECGSFGGFKKMAYVDLSKCNQPDRYVIERPAHHEFTAWNDYEAFQKAKKLCDTDPSFENNLYRITADDECKKVEPRQVFEVTRINAENIEGINTFQLNDYDFCCPKVRKNTIIYDFSDDDLDTDYLDGRVVYQGREYTAVSLDLTDDPDDESWAFLGYVDSHDIKNN